MRRLGLVVLLVGPFWPAAETMAGRPRSRGSRRAAQQTRIARESAFPPTFASRKLAFSLLVGLVVAAQLAACGGHDKPDLAAARSATTTGELVGSTLADVVAKLREEKAGNASLTPVEVLKFLQVETAPLLPARDALARMLTRKGLSLSEMMFLFSQGVASRLPPAAGVVVEPVERPKYEREYKGELRRVVMRGFTYWAAIRAMLVDNGPPKPFRDLLVGDRGPPAKILDSAGNIIVPLPDGQMWSDLIRWIEEVPSANLARDQLTRALGFP